MIENSAKNGLSREMQKEEARITRPFRVMEDNFFSLFERTLQNASFIRYFDLNNQWDKTYWKSLLEREPFIILLEIKLVDTEQLENDLMLQSETDLPEGTREKLIGCIDDWQRRLNNNQSQTLLSKALSALMQNIRQQQEEVARVEICKILNTIRAIQKEYDVYYKDIEKSKIIDPSVAILVATIQNYCEIVSSFNKRWEELPEFYIRKILHVSPLPLVPPSTWLQLRLADEADAVLIPAQTGFVAGKQDNDIPFLYRNEQDTYINRIQLRKIYSYSFNQKLRRKDLSEYIEPEEPAKLPISGLFEEKSEESVVSTGLMIESPMLILREGIRNITITFTLTSDSICPEDPVKLENAFLPQISTEEGWSEISGLRTTYATDSRELKFNFELPVTFPATVICNQETHGIESRMPVLQFIMNPKTDYYPYQWATGSTISQFKIKTDVSGVKNLDIQTVYGPVDVSQAFYPFGPMPEQGAWMVWSNEEVALKPVSHVKLSCKWIDLPVSEEGFHQIYKSYTPPLDNSSFKIRKEFSAGKNWTMQKENNTCPLFSYQFPKGKVQTDSSFSWDIDDGIDFDGQFRILLTEPEIGFGFPAFRELFTRNMIQNSHNKKKVIPPEIPVTPSMDQVEISYVAEEEICFGKKHKQTGTSIYYFFPLSSNTLKKVDFESEAPLFYGVSNKWNLLFGLSGITDEKQIRIFLNIHPIQRTIRTSGFEIIWFIKQKQWNWVKLPPETVRTDTTAGCMKTGLISLALKEPFHEAWQDENGLQWLCAAFKNPPEELHIIPAVSGFYLNCIEVTLDTTTPGFDGKQLPEALPAGSISEAESDIPGIIGINQIVAASGGLPQETSEQLRIRVKNRIRHRNRAVTMRDYQDLVLEKFPAIGKVFCFSNHETEPQYPEVHLVVTPLIYPKEKYPLCDYTLLCKIEDYIKKLASPFVNIKVQNPFYEEITIKCQIVTKQSEVPIGVTVQEIKNRINRVIAPWIERQKQPVFNYTFGLNDLKYEIRDCTSVISISGLTVIQRISYDMYRYRLIEYTENSEIQIVEPTRPGTLLYPGHDHLIRFSGPAPSPSWAGIGDLEIGNTFIIH